MWLYRAKILAVLRGLPSDRDAQRFAAMILVAFVPAVIAGAVFGDFVQTVLYESVRVIAVAFIVGGVVMLLVERFRPAPAVLDAERTPLSRAFGVGMCQTLALVPGVSRSGATIVGGMLMRLDRAAAAEFSFFLAMPTMVAAFVYELLGVREALAPDRVVEIAIGFVAAFIAAALVVRPFLSFVRRSGFAPFAWYRIACGIALLVAFPAG
jgi:undecaprenyl-diphosphatase